MTTLSPKEKAYQLYNESFNRWCYELSHEKNVLTAKNAAEYICDQIIESREDDGRFDDTLLSTGSEYYTPHPMYLTYWIMVKKEIQNINVGYHNDDDLDVNFCPRCGSYDYSYWMSSNQMKCEDCGYKK